MDGLLSTYYVQQSESDSDTDECDADRPQLLDRIDSARAPAWGLGSAASTRSAPSTGAPGATPRLADLSDEIIISVAAWLPDAAVAALMCSCSRWAATIGGAEQLWQQRCVGLWGDDCKPLHTTAQPAPAPGRAPAAASNLCGQAAAPDWASKRARRGDGTIKPPQELVVLACSGAPPLQLAAQSWRRTYLTRRRTLAGAVVALTSMSTDEHKWAVAAAEALGASRCRPSYWRRASQPCQL